MNLERIRAAVPRMDHGSQEKLVSALQDEVDQRCKQWVVSHKAGPMYWLRGPRDKQGNLPAKDPNLWLTKTDNFQYREQGLEAVMPFPYKPFRGTKIDLAALPFEHEFTETDPPDYIDVLMGFLMNTKDILIPKTRQMLTSWASVSFITWYCNFYDHIACIGQSEDDLKATGLIKYSSLLYAHQPAWMRAMHPLKRGEEGTAHKVEWASGSYFIGLPSGIRKSASQHVEVYLSDEAAHIPGWSETINIVKPMAKRLISVSSIAPSDFADECGLDGSIDQQPTSKVRRRGNDSAPFAGPETIQHAARDPEANAGSASIGTGGIRHMLENGMPDIRR